MWFRHFNSVIYALSPRAASACALLVQVYVDVGAISQPVRLAAPSAATSSWIPDVAIRWTFDGCTMNLLPIWDYIYPSSFFAREQSLNLLDRFCGGYQFHTNVYRPEDIQLAELWGFLDDSGVIQAEVEVHVRFLGYTGNHRLVQESR